MEILNKYELAPTQVMPTSWQNVFSFIVTCELRWLSCIGRAFHLVYTIQKAPSETGDIGWYNFNNRKGFMMTIEKKSKLKNLKYDFLFIHHATGLGELPDWNSGKPIQNPFGEPTSEGTKTARDYQYCVR